MIDSVILLWQDMHPSLLWTLIWAIILLIVWCIYRLAPSSSFSLLLWSLYEAVYDFFFDILENDKKKLRLVQYVTILFFIILVYNLAALVFDPIASIWWFDDINGEFFLSEFITLATWDIHFNAAMAIVSILVMLYAQWAAMRTSKTWLLWWFIKVGKTIYEYFPVRGKWLVEVWRGKIPWPLYVPIWIVVKVFDIGISMFIWALDVIGLGAKILSLAARLFGNMLAWWVLSKLLIVWWWTILWWLFTSVFGLDSSFPFLLPIIVYLQGLLVALIQAFVFPLLVAIFIKVAQWEDEEETIIDEISDLVKDFADDVEQKVDAVI